jgi:hypothetical protein
MPCAVDAARSLRISLLERESRPAAAGGGQNRERPEEQRSNIDMRIRQGLTGIGLSVLVAAGAIGMYLTSRPISPASESEASRQPGEPLSLDSRYLMTALQLAAHARTSGERRATEEALSAADRELDLQYAYALQLAAVAHAPATPKILALRARIAKLDEAMAARQAQVSRLRAQLGQLHGERRSALETQLDVRQAELGLLHEARVEAHDALDQAGGSLQSQLARLKAERAALAAQRDNFKFPSQAASPASRSLRSRWSRWQASGRTQDRILAARQAVYAGLARLTGQRSVLAKRIAAEEAQGRAWWNDELTPKQMASIVTRK